MCSQADRRGTQRQFGTQKIESFKWKRFSKQINRLVIR